MPTSLRAVALATLSGTLPFAPTAVRADTGDVTLTPRTVRPGHWVRVTVDRDGCGPTAEVAGTVPGISGAMGTQLRPRSTGDDLTGRFLVTQDTADGRYTVMVSCVNETGRRTATLWVSASGGGTGPATGGGWLAAGEADASVPVVAMVVGLGVLVASGAGGAAWAGRRRGGGDE